MSTMTICSRDNCLPANVKIDTMVKCFRCQHEIHLPCIGIKCKAAEISSPNVRFFCDECLNETITTNDANEVIDLNASMDVMSTPKKRITIQAIMKEVNQLKSIVEENGKKLDSIDAKTTTICTSTDSLVNKALRPSLANTPYVTPFGTPKNPTPLKSYKTYAAAARHGATNGSSSIASAKRKRVNDESENAVKKFDAPKPKVGTKKTATALNIVPTVTKPKPTEKPSFSKSIWISRFNPTTEPSEIANYIVAETPVIDKAKFNVHKLVKKSADLSTMKFVSFKIELNEEEYNVLNDSDMWPEHVMVRPFIENQTLGSFFPSLHRKSATVEEIPMDQASPNGPNIVT